MQMGRVLFESLENITRVQYGYAQVRDVVSKQLDDRMSSFFLAETCKYLYLLFDEDNFVNKNPNYIITTEGHIFPLSLALHQTFSNRQRPTL